MEITILICRNCEEDFEPTHFNQVHCSKKCKRSFEQENRRLKNYDDGSKKLNKQLNKLADWLNEEMPIVKKEIDLSKIPYNMKF